MVENLWNVNDCCWEFYWRIYDDVNKIVEKDFEWFWICSWNRVYFCKFL